MLKSTTSKTITYFKVKEVLEAVSCKARTGLLTRASSRASFVLRVTYNG